MNLHDLAVFGGTPAFPDGLHVGRPNIGNRCRLMERIAAILDRRWLTNQGPCVLELESRISDLLGVRNCILMCNGTVAMEVAIAALGLKGEVIVPSLTFIATAHALQWKGVTPVFCDIDRRTHNLDPARVEEAITKHTSGIIGVHLWGRSCNSGRLSEIANRYRLKLLFDAAHAFDCESCGSMVGGFGNAEVFSFHATKFFNTFEGGAVTTNDDELADRIRIMQNFGFEDYDRVVSVGTNGKMTEISAAMGLTGLESLNDFISVNVQHYREYDEQLSGIPGIDLVRYDGSGTSNYQYVVVEIDEPEAGLSRDTLVDVLWAEGAYARRYFYPGCHRMEPYRSLYPDAGLRLPETERMVERLLCLPTGTGIAASEIRKICEILRMVVREAPEVNRKLTPKTPVPTFESVSI